MSLLCRYEYGDEEELELYELEQVLLPDSKAGSKRKVLEPATAAQQQEKPSPRRCKQAAQGAGKAGNANAKQSRKAAGAGAADDRVPISSIDDEQLHDMVDAIATHSKELVRPRALLLPLRPCENQGAALNTAAVPG
jgi:hypothetical protein